MRSHALLVAACLLGVMSVQAGEKDGSVAGRVFQREREVGVRQMMGRPVFLVAVNDSTTAFMDSLRASPRAAEYGVGQTPRSPRRTNMDERGRFRFGRVAPGDYYIYAQVKWPVPLNVGWGAGASSRTVERIVAGRVTVRPGERTECVLEPVDR